MSANASVSETAQPLSRLIDLADDERSLRLEVAWRCDQGCVRSNNEDRIGVFTDRDSALLVVADGMGGHAAGEVAAQLAVDTLAETWQMQRPLAPPEFLAQAVTAANAAIHAQGEANPTQKGMGTTVTALLLGVYEGWFIHVGDSRLYMLRDGVFRQVSEDHSLVRDMVREGLLLPAEAKNHPCRNIIVRALGSQDAILPQIDEDPLVLKYNDRFLLCSDGLHDLVDDNEISEHLAAPVVNACQSLVELARQRGGKDNISVLVCRVVEAA